MVIIIICLTDKYNAYLKINGGVIGEASCDRAAKETDARCIDENTPLIAFISHKYEEVSDFDWLYKVLMHIVSLTCMLMKSSFIGLFNLDWMPQFLPK